MFTLSNIAKAFSRWNITPSLQKTANYHWWFGNGSTLSSSSLSSTLFSSNPSHSPLLKAENAKTIQPNRTRVMFNHLHGKPESVQDVIDRFYRLYNGLWIRTKAGRNKKKWKKSLRRMHKLKQHVVCNKTQCRMLDKMVNIEFKVPHYPVNDPYEIYHRKSNLPDYRYQPPKFFP